MGHEQREGPDEATFKAETVAVKASLDSLARIETPHLEHGIVSFKPKFNSQAEDKWWKWTSASATVTSQLSWYLTAAYQFLHNG